MDGLAKLFWLGSAFSPSKRVISRQVVDQLLVNILPGDKSSPSISDGPSGGGACKYRIILIDLVTSMKWLICI